MSINPSTKRTLLKTPEKYHPVKTRKDGRLFVALSPKTKELQNIVYVFKNFETEERLVGYTGSRARKRLYSYHSAFNHPYSESGQRPLPVAVRRNPDQFGFGILARTSNPKELRQLEADYIQAKNSMHQGYNQNKGGGGGSTHAENKQSPSALKTPPKPRKKSYPLRANNNGTVKISLTPKVKKETHNRSVLYQFQNRVTAQSYVGKTKSFARRMSQHTYTFNHPERQRGQRKLPRSVRNAPQNFEVKVLDILRHGDRPTPKEKKAISRLNAFEKGYNSNRGGGGPTSTTRLVYD